MLDMVPSDNFYRKLLSELDLHFLYKATQSYYGKEGQKSLDPVVFFKILLVGYLNNINSDRNLCMNPCHGTAPSVEQDNSTEKKCF